MPTIEKLDEEIRRLQAEVTSVEMTPPTIAERCVVVERELHEAEALYRAHGLNPTGARHPSEHAYLQRQSVVGMCMVAAGDKLLKVERELIAAAGEGRSAVDKTKRTAELKAAILRTAARRELEVRKVEGDDFAARPVHPELFLYRQAEVERLAAAGR